MRKSNLLLCTVIVMLLTTNGECAAVFDIELFNNTNEVVGVEMTNVAGEITRIMPGKAKKFFYYREWYLAIAGRRFHYVPVTPNPPNFVPLPKPPYYCRIAHIFSSSFQAQLNPDFRIYLFPIDARPPVSIMPVQPEGFPIVLKQQE